MHCSDVTSAFIESSGIEADKSSSGTSSGWSQTVGSVAVTNTSITSPLSCVEWSTADVTRGVESGLSTTSWEAFVTWSTGACREQEISWITISEQKIVRSCEAEAKSGAVSLEGERAKKGFSEAQAWSGEGETGLQIHFLCFKGAYWKLGDCLVACMPQETPSTNSLPGTEGVCLEEQSLA